MSMVFNNNVMFTSVMASMGFNFVVLTSVTASMMDSCDFMAAQMTVLVQVATAHVHTRSEVG